MCQIGNCPFSNLKILSFQKKGNAEIETGMAGNSSCEQANRRQKLGLVWRVRKKISQIIRLLSLTVLPPNYFMP